MKLTDTFVLVLSLFSCVSSDEPATVTATAHEEDTLLNKEDVRSADDKIEGLLDASFRNVLTCILAYLALNTGL